MQQTIQMYPQNLCHFCRNYIHPIWDIPIGNAKFHSNAIVLMWNSVKEDPNNNNNNCELQLGDGQILIGFVSTLYLVEGHPSNGLHFHLSGIVLNLHSTDAVSELRILMRYYSNELGFIIMQSYL